MSTLVESQAMNLTTAQIVFLIAVIAYTLITSWTDLRRRKIYNWTTVSMWSAGWVYQGLFFGWDGIWNGLIGFLIGFGLFFVLWIIGSAGGGDVKLMGGLSVWIGKTLILKLILASLIFVVLGTAVAVVLGISRQGWKKTKSDLAASKQKPKNAEEAMEAKAKRRVMAFAPSIALGTWCVLALFRHQW